MTKEVFSNAPAHPLEGPVRTDSTLPWAKRKEEEWRGFVTKNEVTRLFYLGFMHRNLPLSDHSRKIPAWVNQWELKTPLKAYWEGDTNLMMQDVMAYKTKEDGLEKNRGNKAQELSPYVSAIFDDQRFFEYLRVTRNILKKRDHQPSFDLAGKRRDALGYDQETMDAMEKRYHALVEIFLPTANKKASFKFGPGMEADDWQGVAGVKTVQAVLNFYWETVLIDPTYTTARFMRMLNSSINEPSTWKMDTRKLEVSTEAMSRYSSPDVTESAAMKDLSEEYVRSLVRLVSDSDVEAQVLSLKIFDNINAPEIANEVGLPQRRVLQILEQSRKRLGTLIGNDHPDMVLPKHRRSPFWDRLFENLDKYRKDFEHRKGMLKPFHQAIVQKFFELQTGERESSIQAVWRSMKDNGWNITPDTVRRAINSGINKLDYRERERGGNKAWDKTQQVKLVREVAQDPNIWNALSPQKRHVLQRYFIDGNARTVTFIQIGLELGIDESTASREADRSFIEIFRARGSIKGNAMIARKARHLLPS